MVGLQSHPEQPVIRNGRACEGKLCHTPFPQGDHYPEIPGKLVVFRMVVRQCFGPEDVTDHGLELPPGDGDADDLFLKGKQFRQVSQGHQRPQLRQPQTAGTQKHHIQTQIIPEQVRCQTAQLGLPVPGGMGVGACQPGNVAVVFLLRCGAVGFDQLLQSLISGTVIAVDGDQLPGKLPDGVGVRVDGQIEASELVRTCDSLDNGNTGHNAGFLQIGMGMSADDDVHAPSGIQQGCKLLILLKADMGQQHRQIHILCPVSVADPAHLGSGLVDIDEGTDQPFLPGLGQHLLG